jgi:prepilin-type N-terminal cleavage/methylation domain-containing protein
MRRAFTLIELLVVIAIIAILAAILFPVFANAKLAANRTTALSNMRQITMATVMYANDHNDGLPRTMQPDPMDSNAPPITIGWWDVSNYQRALESYMRNGLGGVSERGEGNRRSVWFDPSDPDRSIPVMWGSFSDNGHLTGVARNLSQIAEPSGTIYHGLRGRDWATITGNPVPADWRTLPQNDPFWSSTYFDMCVDPWADSSDPSNPFHWSTGRVPPPPSLFPQDPNGREWDLLDKTRYGRVAPFSRIDGSVRTMAFEATYRAANDNMWDIF